MDATKLPPPAAAVVPAPAAAPVLTDAGATLPDANGLATIGGRFVLGASTPTPTGAQSLARDTKDGGAKVVVKIVPTTVLPSPAMIDRALRELKQLAKVSSDRILKIVDQGRLEDGSVYVATESLPGVTLEALLATDAPLPLDRACKIVLQIGEALTEAQKVGVIHRDVSPRSVYVGANDQVKVGDFGLAEPISDKVFGSPAYLSPEQIEGRPVDQRSNIYSLGALLYHALTGAPPFVGDTDSVLQQHQTGAVPSVATARPDLPAEADKLLGKALEKSGGRRHLTLRQLLTEIEALSTRKSTGAPPPAKRAPAATVMGLPEMLPPPARGRVEPDLGGATVQDMPAVAAPIASPTPAPAPSELKTLMADTKPAVAPEAPKPALAPQSQPQPQINASPQVQAAVAAAQTKVQQAKAAAQASKPPAKAGFRETAWFKAGELQEEFDKAAAEAANASGGDPLARSGTTGEHAVVGGEVDVNKLDVTAQDRARLSLKTGATQAMAVIKAPVAGSVGEQMNEEEMLAEIDSSKKWFIIAGVGIGAVVVAVVLWLVLSKKSDAKVDPPKADVTTKTEAVPTGTQPVLPAKTEPKPDTKPDVKIEKPSGAGAQALAAAETAMAANSLSEAVDNVLKARAAGVDAKAEKNVELTLAKALNKQAVASKKKKDRAKEAEARGLMAKLKKR